MVFKNLGAQGSNDIMARLVSSQSYTTSVAAESTACIHRFCKRFPVGSRRAVSEMVAAYGIRALLAEVPFERLTLGDISSAADLAIRDLDSILASDKPSRIKRGVHRVARPCKPRSDAARAWPFVDEIGGVEDVLSGENLNSENRLSFEKLPAREQIRRCKATYSNFRRGRDALPAEFVSLALEDVVGRHLSPATHDKFFPKKESSLSLLQFLRLVRQFLKTPAAELPDGPDDDELWDQALNHQALPISAPPSLLQKNPPKKKKKVNVVVSPPVEDKKKLQVPKHLANVQSKIKPDLDERRKALRRRKTFAKEAQDELLGEDDDHRPPRNNLKALAIADAFLKSPLVAQWGAHAPDDDSTKEDDDDSDDDERQ